MHLRQSRAVCAAAQGHACGGVAVRPLATASVLPCAGVRLLGRCGGRVTCLLAAGWEAAPAALLAGAEDGAVTAWRLARPLGGAPLFRVPLHTGPVRGPRPGARRRARHSVNVPPAGARAAWLAAHGDGAWLVPRLCALGYVTRHTPQRRGPLPGPRVPLEQRLRQR